MKKFLFLAATVFMVVGCGNGDEDGVTLSTNNVSLFSEGTTTVTASEAVTWESQSNFVAKVSEDGVITGNHVGKTVITATAANTKAQCEVEVKAKYSRFTEPVLEFGVSKAVVKLKEKRTVTKDDANGLGYNGENSAVKGVAYLFENDKLKSAALAINLSSSSEAMSFLLERYQPIGEKNDVFYFINNDADKYTMAITLSIESGYVMIMYFPQSPSRSVMENNSRQEFKSLLGV